MAGKGSQMQMLMTLLTVGLLVIGGIAVYAIAGPGTGVPSGAAVDSTGKLVAADEATLSCPDSKRTSVTLDLTNSLNTTGSEGVDVETRFYQLDSAGEETFYARITDTTAPTASNLPCGKTFVVKLESTDGANGDNSVVTKINSGDGSIVDGNYVFSTHDSDMAIDLGTPAQATLEARMFDFTNNAFMYDTGDNSNTDYETDGVRFTSTTDNATNMTVGASGELHVKGYYRAVQTDTNWNDRATVILFDAGATVWDIAGASVKVNGVDCPDAKGELTLKEGQAWTGYERVCIVDREILNTKPLEVELDLFAQSGVNPGAADAVQIDIGARGQYQKASTANDLAIGGVMDDSSATVVRSLMDSQIDVQ